jgi:hypothetical protein
MGATISVLDLGSDLDLQLDLPPRVKRLVETKAFGRCVSKVSHGAGRAGRLRATASLGGAEASYMATGPRDLPGPGGTTPRRSSGLRRTSRGQRSERSDNWLESCSERAASIPRAGDREASIGLWATKCSARASGALAEG